LVVHDDGSGPALYAGGSFTTAGGQVVNRIARWDGTSWLGLGNGVPGLGAGAGVNALTVHDDGNGPALLVGGDFTTAGGVTVRNVARWDGASWSALGTGGPATCYSLASFDEGSGAVLFAGGSSLLWLWDGAAWSALTMNGQVRALQVHDDGGGPALYAGGRFTTADGLGANQIARWDGSGWSTLGSGLDAHPVLTEGVRALASFRGRLAAGGDFLDASGAGDCFVVQWGCPTPVLFDDKIRR
jgi:hypothetical protein